MTKGNVFLLRVYIRVILHIHFLCIHELKVLQVDIHCQLVIQLGPVYYGRFPGKVEALQLLKKRRIQTRATVCEYLFPLREEGLCPN